MQCGVVLWFVVVVCSLVCVLYSTVLYCTVLYCTVLYCTVLRSTVPSRWKRFGPFRDFKSDRIGTPFDQLIIYLTIFNDIQLHCRHSRKY